MRLSPGRGQPHAHSFMQWPGRQGLRLGWTIDTWTHAYARSNVSLERNDTYSRTDSRQYWLGHYGPQQMVLTVTSLALSESDDVAPTVPHHDARHAVESVASRAKKTKKLSQFQCLNQETQKCSCNLCASGTVPVAKAVRTVFNPAIAIKGSERSIFRSKITNADAFSEPCGDRMRDDMNAV